MGGALEPAVHDRQMSRRRPIGRRELETRIGYAFADKSLLDSALTHISALSGKSRDRQLSAPRIPRRPRSRPRHLRHAVPRLRQGRRGRTVAPACRSRPQGDLRRGRAHHRPRRRDPARRLGGQCRRPPAHRHPRRCLRGADRRGFPRRRLCRGRGPRRAVMGRAPAHAGASAARPQDHAAGMGAGARPADTRPIARSLAPGRITIRSSASRWNCRSSCRPKAWAAPSAPPNRPPPPPCCRARAWRRPAEMSDGPAAWSRIPMLAPRDVRLHRHHRRAECRQVHPRQRASRQQGHDRQPQGADDARDASAASPSQATPSSFSSTRRAFSRRAGGSTAPWWRPPGAGAHDADIVALMIDARRGLDDETAAIAAKSRRSSRRRKS